MVDIIEEISLGEQTEARGMGCVIRNVRDVFELSPGRWACRVDLIVDGEAAETVEYVADEADTMNTGRWVVARILAGNAGSVGAAGEYEVWKAAQEAADWAAKADADRKAELRALAASLRWERETGGVEWNGHTVSTDRESQGKVSALYQMARDALVTSAQWKFADGTFTTLTAGDIQAMGQAVAAHVQAAFDAEAEVLAAIEAGTVTTKAAVEAAIL